MEELAADFRGYAAKIRWMADGRTPEAQARLRIIAQNLDDRGNALLKQTTS